MKHTTILFFSLSLLALTAIVSCHKDQLFDKELYRYYVKSNYPVDTLESDHPWTLLQRYHVAVTADVWDCSESWEYVNEVAAAISGDIGSFKRLICDDGYIIVTKGSPFAQNLADDIYKRVYMNLNLTFITTK